MSTRPTSSEALAEALREEPPVLDDLARARIEKAIVGARPARAPRRSRPLVAIGAGVLVAAAAVVGLLMLPADSPEIVPVAHFDLHEHGASRQRGTLEEGSTIETASAEEADIQVAGSRLRVGGESRVRIATLSSEHLAIDLLEGSVRVAFHPRERGRERMTVETPSARVEVVGTVFRVEVRESGTDVSVSEGVVRVVPLDGSAVTLVHAGERTHVGRERRAAEQAPVEPAREALEEREGADVTGEAELILVEESAETEIAREEATLADETGEPDPATKLEQARRLIARGRRAAALRLLRELTHASVPAPVRTEAWMTAADLHRHAGQLDEAARAYEQAARAGRGTANGHNAIFTLARLQQQRGDIEAARASYERYLREAPDGALASQARRALARLRAEAE